MKTGDRVTRKQFFDDGTWHREGDACLKNSPLRHGAIVGVRSEYEVLWDDGNRQAYLEHGIQREESHE